MTLTATLKCKLGKTSKQTTKKKKKPKKKENVRNITNLMFCQRSGLAYLFMNHVSPILQNYLTEQRGQYKSI